MSSCTSYEGRLPSQITRKATDKARAAPTKSHLTDTAEVLGASEEPPVLLPGVSPKKQIPRRKYRGDDMVKAGGMGLAGWRSGRFYLLVERILPVDTSVQLLSM